MTVEAKQSFLKAIDQLERLPKDGSFHALRQSARHQFRELPFPTPRTEDWRFTNVAPILQTAFEPAAALTEIEAGALPAPSAANAVRLTFINGWFAPKLSSAAALPGG